MMTITRISTALLFLASLSLTPKFAFADAAAPAADGPCERDPQHTTADLVQEGARQGFFFYRQTVPSDVELDQHTMPFTVIRPTEAHNLPRLDFPGAAQLMPPDPGVAVCRVRQAGRWWYVQRLDTGNLIYLDAKDLREGNP